MVNLFLEYETFMDSVFVILSFPLFGGLCFFIKESSKASKLKEAFTFMELVIAMTILMLLAMVVGPPMLKYVGRAKVYTTEANLKVLQSSIDEFHSEIGKYPESLRDLVRMPTDVELAKNWKEPFLHVKGEQIPLDGWKKEFIYEQLASGSKPPYELYSWGEHGEGSPKEEWFSAW